MQIIGIKRAVKHSPNHINNDATIFQMVADQLQQKGHQLTTYHEHEFLKLKPDTAALKDVALIFSMSRNRELLAILSGIQQSFRGQIQMINSPRGISNCFRSNITRILLNQQIATAPSQIIPTAGYAPDDLKKLDQGHGLWLKRGDFHAIIKEDVVFAKNSDEAAQLLANFHSRSIAEVVVSTHLEGDLIKFYGVSGTNFFHWLYPYDKGHYKYKEFKAINGATHYFDFDHQLLKSMADQASVAAEVPIYGGDAVINDKGDIAIIDFNDWPSFAPCRDQAASAITRRLIQALEAMNRPTARAHQELS
ncbi:hypothetical protein SAMN05192529_12423 [Arachidicoccus rhizosphaerae]|uniref:Glutathione synthase/RimK-type ligase, ATP-grasp superfamily n=1 Tax=Arachidicoccus rhizosphaerae TaxID=551991 RepID=A0A1H4BU25_9BACT|nr:hypothetical protein [Arachidicoccus rhizosphaerae]SEA51332.1 hypothetical protein SAMN05192529_12423 [Arachidicoccus rhizosphaerae]